MNTTAPALRPRTALKLLTIALVAAGTALTAGTTHAANLANGLVLNGIKQNGLVLNGLQLNGLVLNGMKQNGFSLNGMKNNGFSLNGTEAGSGALRVDDVKIEGGRLVRR